MYNSITLWSLCMTILLQIESTDPLSVTYYERVRAGRFAGAYTRMEGTYVVVEDIKKTLLAPDYEVSGSRLYYRFEGF